MRTSTEFSFAGHRVAVAVIALVAIAGIGVWLVRFDEVESGPPVRPAPTPTFATHFNSQGGFSFAHPSEWTVTDVGKGSKLSNSDQGIVIYLRPARAEDPFRLSDQVLEELEQEYRSVRPLGARSESVRGHVAVVRRGLLFDETGRRIRFKSLVVDADSGDFEILVLADADVTDRSEVAGVIWGVLESFSPES